MSNETILKIDNLSVSLPSRADRAFAVEEVSFELYAGEILCIVGESGSGKSMASNAVMGLLPKPHVRPVNGRIMFENQDLLTVSDAEMQKIRGGRIGMIFQEPMTALNPVMKVEDQLDEVFVSHGKYSRAERKQRIIEMLRDVGLPDPEIIGRSYPFALSGGQRQRVMIAMALALEPSVLIADEPTTALDVTTQAQILGLVKDLQEKRGMGVIFITHDFGVVAEIADRVIVMQTGRIVEQGSAEQVLNSPKHPYTQKLIAAVPHLEAVHKSAKEPTPVISVKNLQKTYGGNSGFFGGKGRVVHATRDVNFEIYKGETLGLVGESGSGKSTVGRCLIRLHDADSGQILFDGKDINSLTLKEMMPVRRHIQMIFQDPYASLNPRRKIGDIIVEGPVIHGAVKSEAMKKAGELLELVGLDPSALKRYPHEFSGGQRQRIGIARALAMDPKLLIADEAVSALDVSVQAQVLELLDEIKERLHLSMLFVTHDLRVAAKICDRIAVMRLGEIVEYGETSKVFNNPQHPYTRALLDAVPGKAWEGPQLEEPISA
ncbi:ABC transporter ATP-binding protein [Motiliproteus sp. MSK22-1]|uniref:ABC transporter ATP-binding protein n=1 Tax=Motiliproteus sp. MSK22-1 TaxID=1897630 RepID=UPI0009775F58|nr:ABC transporter ATP-binding protein [Motiliproteus sp. MSK22-1]OMH38097.1 microcin ABC transporter ATP-binding protein [Motiliproteus sp. MSK22-1]